eukprot:TRINITY_DN9727_c0_g1_i1.p1 TRINITY_DN9727_c0_g1~~TRINITY_DN9727_c0_g1_i1.p1  ORF type:complete len:127 (+),score=24.63 TRINITY_DN9727_c0_g1_i1:85-465(+)
MGEYDRAKVVPASLKASELRACLVCGLLKTFKQFEEDGCENCRFLKLETDEDLVEKCTTSNFNGIISMMRPEKSWVARWRRITGPNKRRPAAGCYAVAVYGRLPGEIISRLEDKNIRYRPLDLIHQ